MMMQSLDPVAQLVGLADARGARIVMLVMSDQFGVAHAPFGGARALLAETGHARAAVLVHASSGELLEIPAVGTAHPPTLFLTHSLSSSITRYHSFIHSTHLLSFTHSLLTHPLSLFLTHSRITHSLLTYSLPPSLPLSLSLKEELVPHGCASALSEHLQTVCS